MDESTNISCFPKSSRVDKKSSDIFLRIMASIPALLASIPALLASIPALLIGALLIGTLFFVSEANTNDQDTSGQGGLEAKLEVPEQLLDTETDTDQYKETISITSLPDNLFNGIDTSTDKVYEMLHRLIGGPVNVAYAMFFEGDKEASISSEDPPTAIVLFLRIMLHLGLIVFCIYVFYVTFVGLIRTGTTGKFLGEKWDSFWVPLRIAGALTTIIPIPAFGGLGMIQMLVLGCALLGISIASVAYSFLASNLMTTAMIRPQYDPNSTFAKQLLYSQLCAAGIQELSLKGIDYRQHVEHNNNTDPSSSDFVSNYLHFQKNYAVVEKSERAEINGLKSSPIITYVSNTTRVNVGHYGRCGYVDIESERDVKSDDWEDVPISKREPQVLKDARNAIRFEQEEAITKLYSDLYEKVTKFLVPQNGNTATYSEMGKGFHEAVKDFDIRMRKNLENEIKGIVEALQKDFFESIDSGGFGMAPTHYWMLEHQQDKINELYQYTVPTMKGGVHQQKMTPRHQDPRPCSYYGGGCAMALAMLDTDLLHGNILSSEEFSLRYEVFLKAAETIVQFAESENDPLKLAAKVADSETNAMLVWIEQGLAKMMIQGVRSVSGGGSTNKNIDPLLEIRNLGQIINAATAALFGSYFLSSFIAGNGSVWAKMADAATGMLSGAEAGLLAVGPIIASLITTLATLGILLGTVIPMLPYVMFTLGLVGYLIYVLEGLSGSPVWAALHADPDGHDVWGRGGSGYGVILTLTLRPILMIGGFFIGMGIFRVLASFVNETLFLSHQFMAMGGFDILGSLGILLLYTTIQFANAYKCFQLSHAFPNAVLRWLGVNDHQDLGELEGKQITVGAVASVGGGLGGVINSQQAGIEGRLKKQQGQEGEGGGGGKGGQSAYSELAKKTEMGKSKTTNK